MAARSNNNEVKLLEAPIELLVAAAARQRKAQELLSAPPCVTFGQLLRGVLLALAVLACSDAPTLKSRLQRQAVANSDGAKSDIDLAPVASLGAAKARDAESR